MSIVDQHKELCLDLNKLFARKNHDYGNSFSKTFRMLGIISAVTQIAHKFNRLVEIVTSGHQEIPEETIEDTLIDLANYALMTVLELRNAKSAA